MELEIQEIPPHLRSALLIRLWIGQEFDRIAEHCRSLPDEIDEDLQETIEGMFQSALIRGQMPLARALA